MTLALLLGLPLAALWLATLVALLLNRDPPELRTRVNGRYLKSLSEAQPKITAAHCTWRIGDD